MIGDVVAGRYTLEELVGSGGMSSVYRAHDSLLERDVAMKILHASYREDREAVERFRREARSVAQLSHPNVVTVIDRGEEDGRQFIVFEYVPGRTLKDHLAHTGPLPVDEALAIAIDVGEALAYAHRSGIVHRDVKPQNVLLNGNGAAKVTDFGIARSVDVEKGVTQTGTVMGTGDYIAPEQASGRGVVPVSDVYGLGCVLFELLTGSPPFSGAGFVEVAMQHIHTPAPDVREARPDVRPRVAAALQRAMAKEPADRFGSMEEFVGELRACLGELSAGGPADGEATAVVPRRRQGPPAVGTSAPMRPRRPRGARRRSGLPALPILVALLVAAAVAAGLLLSRGDEPLATNGAAGGAAQRVELTAVRSYDPEGDDGAEHEERVALATDGDVGSYWTTSSYRYPGGGLGKSGVGIVLDAGQPVELQRVVVRSDTPGFTAEIRAGRNARGPFGMAAAGEKQVGGRTAFEIGDVEARYWLVWIKNLGTNSSVHINEIAAR